MKNLFLAIILISLLFLIFKIFKKAQINSFHAVVVNYYVCLITGILFLGYLPTPTQFGSDWLQFGILTGSLFLPTFYLMACTIEKLNVSVATVANKMSLIIPVVFSYFFLRKGPDHFSLINISGIGLAILAIILTSYKKPNGDKRPLFNYYFLLPIALFTSGGVLDSMVNYANYAFLEGKEEGLFTIVMFGTAAAIGTIALGTKMIYTRQGVALKDVLGGLILGIPNFFSLYFFLKALSDFNNDGALLFPVVNISVIITATLLAVLLFKESLSLVNLSGIVLSALSLILLFW